MSLGFPLSTTASHIFDALDALDFLWEEGWNGLAWRYIRGGDGTHINKPGIYLVDSLGLKSPTVILGSSLPSLSRVVIVDAAGDAHRNPIVIKTLTGDENEGRDWMLSVPLSSMRFFTPDGTNWKTIDELQTPRAEGVLPAITLAEPQVLRSITLTDKNALSLHDTVNENVKINIPEGRRVAHL